MLHSLNTPTFYADAMLSWFQAVPCRNGFGVTRQHGNPPALAARCAR
jgi:hypothetical protein